MGLYGRQNRGEYEEEVKKRARGRDVIGCRGTFALDSMKYIVLLCFENTS